MLIVAAASATRNWRRVSGGARRSTCSCSGQRERGRDDQIGGRILSGGYYRSTAGRQRLMLIAGIIMIDDGIPALSCETEPTKRTALDERVCAQVSRRTDAAKAACETQRSGQINGCVSAEICRQIRLSFDLIIKRATTTTNQCGNINLNSV